MMGAKKKRSVKATGGIIFIAVIRIWCRFLQQCTAAVIIVSIVLSPEDQREEHKHNNCNGVKAAVFLKYSAKC
jgi:hypothetical protein